MQNEDEEELGAPVNIYHEHRSHLEQDKKARIELDTHMLKDELYDPISTSDLNTTNATINNMNTLTGLAPPEVLLILIRKVEAADIIVRAADKASERLVQLRDIEASKEKCPIHKT
ncbi:19242_t:CDS:2 [Entrophospora sp. SA101]|nr:19242_t:CDS:2 [Entrophospora sp. SA101]